MIIRKPYAFLIKYFKIIHIGLFIIMTYMLFRMRSFYVFFSDFLSTGTYTTLSNISNLFSNVLSIFFVIVLIAFSLLIFLLMRQKRKPVFYYIASTIYYFLTFVAIILFINVFRDLEYEVISNQALVIFRDISMVLYFLNYYFLGVAFARGFGFNIKKFNFEQDLKELDITAEDREEIELGANIDVSKVSNYLRRKRRNVIYYLKENSFVLITLLVIVTLSLVAYFSINKLIFNKTYHEKDLITLRDLDYKVNASYLTNQDMNGKYIKNKDTYYLVVDFNVLNKTDKGFKLDIENTRVKIRNHYYYPVNNVSNKFSDIGTTYKEQTVKSKVDSNYIVIYEIGNNTLKFQKALFQIYYGKKVNNGEATLYYKNVSLKPYTFKEKNIGKYNYGNEIDLKDTYLKSGKFKFINYEVLDIVNYKYTKCTTKCVEYDASIVPGSGKSLLKIDYESDSKVNLFQYLTIEYEVDNINYRVNNSSVKIVTPSNYEEKNEIIEIPETAASAKLKFIFNLRGYNFSVE